MPQPAGHRLLRCGPRIRHPSKRAAESSQVLLVLELEDAAGAVLGGTSPRNRPVAIDDGDASAAAAGGRTRGRFEIGLRRNAWGLLDQSPSVASVAASRRSMVTTPTKRAPVEHAISVALSRRRPVSASRTSAARAARDVQSERRRRQLPQPCPGGCLRGESRVGVRTACRLRGPSTDAGSVSTLMSAHAAPRTIAWKGGDDDHLLRHDHDSVGAACRAPRREESPGRVAASGVPGTSTSASATASLSQGCQTPPLPVRRPSYESCTVPERVFTPGWPRCAASARDGS